MAEESREQGVADLNAIGTAKYCGQRMGEGPGGNPNRGYLDQPMPTAEIAKGQDVSSKDDFAKGVRRQMSSVQGNKSLARKESRR